MISLVVMERRGLCFIFKENFEGDLKRNLKEDSTLNKTQTRTDAHMHLG